MTDLHFQDFDTSTIINDLDKDNTHLNDLTICHPQDSVNMDATDPTSDHDISRDMLPSREDMQCIGSWLRAVKVSAAQNPQGFEPELLKETKAHVRERGIPMDWFTKPWSEKNASEEASSFIAIGFLVVLGLLTARTTLFAIAGIKSYISQRRFASEGANYVDIEPRSRLPFGLRRGPLGGRLGPPVSLELEVTVPPAAPSEPGNSDEIAEGDAADTSRDSVSPADLIPCAGRYRMTEELDETLAQSGRLASPNVGAA
ncbi:hypothetical protein QFC20_003694 [Naganishia adeliensis]|uniref:Uncharacterized protein n=1 Tax=Naganishia adeliensis TaxID=92952 RepID=A0ACC2W968_9TREE|nr:hypothetical protein QFC20_003694 [Naganishia adeliensis]